MRNTWAIVVVLLLAACAGAPRVAGVRAELRADHGYEGREDDSASIRRIDDDAALRAALRAPAVVELSRALGEDWGLPFDPADAPELVAWSRDEVLREAVLDPGVRRETRRLADAGILGPGSYRLGRGPMWRESPVILAKLLRHPGATWLVLELGEGYGYRFTPLDAPSLGRMDGPLRDALRRPEVRRAWTRISRAGRVSFRPAVAAAVVALAGVDGAAPLLSRLRVEFRVRITAVGLASFAAIARDEGLRTRLFSPAHAALLAFLRDRPGPRATLDDLPGTLALSLAGDARETLRWLEPSGWSRRFDRPDGVAAVGELMSATDARRRTTAKPPEDAGRGAPLRSARALADALAGRSPRLDAWLETNDSSFRGRLPDPGGSRGSLEAAILGTRGNRETAPRPGTAHDESGRSLPFMSRVDLLKILGLQAALASPDVIGHLVAIARTDREDRRGEYGGWVEVEESGRLVWRRSEVLAGGGTAGDRTHRLAQRPDPRTALATWHVHAVGGRAVAGPSSGATVSDLASARRLGVDGVVVTLLEGGRIDVDYHDTRGHVFDLGIFESP